MGSLNKILEQQINVNRLIEDIISDKINKDEIILVLNEYNADLLRIEKLERLLEEYSWNTLDHIMCPSLLSPEIILLAI